MNLQLRASALRANGGLAKPPLIAVRDVEKVYGSGVETVRALDRVSFDIEEGELIAIMGPSGSGKSTMMHLLGALDVPTAGAVLINGQDIGRLSSEGLADLRNRTIGFVFQQFNLLPRTTALRQVMLPLGYARPRPLDMETPARRRLEQVGMGNRLGHAPHQLSGGQQQRVAIARALVNNPKLLLADEPTGALDSKTSAEIMALLCELNQQGITIVVVTHDAEVARYARRRIIFHDGALTNPSSGPGPLPVAP
jgi:putative ABC transport system ATP-binding protein